MKVLVTGATGLVGREAVKSLLEAGHEVRAFDLPGKAIDKLCKDMTKAFGARYSAMRGDVRNPLRVDEAVSGCDAVAHLAAIIPPKADEDSTNAWSVNVGGTRNVVASIKRQERMPALVYTSSIAIYGDRLQSPIISADDAPNPNSDDYYAQQKLECEKLIREAGVPWTVLRLTYIVATTKLDLDPLMYRMPLGTAIEICDSRDAGLAIARACASGEARGRVLNVAGGARCRISYEAYIDRMLHLFGLGGVSFIPKQAFSDRGYHCGFMDTRESQALLDFQRHGLDDYFHDVARACAGRRLLGFLFRPIAQAAVLARSAVILAEKQKKGQKVRVRQAARA